MSIDLNEYTSESQAVSVKPLPSENQPTRQGETKWNSEV